MLLMSGHTAQAAPIAGMAVAASVRKSRRVSPSCEWAPAGPDCTVSAMKRLSPFSRPANPRDRRRAGRAQAE